jgi:hypothetical protein
VQFVGEDGRQRRLFDFSTLPGHPRIREELAEAFTAATGPLGSWKRAQSAKNLWLVARRTARWLADQRPTLSTLARLSAADVQLLGMSLQTPSGDQQISVLRALLRVSPLIQAEATAALARLRGVRRAAARQPYTEDELRRITVVARGIVRRARHRLGIHWDLVAEKRAGRLDDRGPEDPRRSLAEALDRVASADGEAAVMAGQRQWVQDRGAAGCDLLESLHLTVRDAWAFAVLLAALTGLNASVLDELPADHLRASGPDEPGVALVDGNKARRGSRSTMTMPLTALPPQVHPPASDSRPATVLNTSLTTAFGVFTALVELGEPTRRLLGSRRAFVCYTGPRRSGGAPRFREGIPSHLRGQRQRWLRGWMTGEQRHDDVLVGISLDRLRKTYLALHRRPVAHTPDTLARYLRRMHAVTEQGYQIVREALDEQVANALARRQMTVTTQTAAPTQAAGQDTVLGSCTDFDRSPLDGGRCCRQTFLACLDCTNARAFPRHLPLQMLVLQELQARRAVLPLETWVGEFAGRVAQLQQVIEEYEPAQRAHARTLITDADRRLVARLFSGDLDPL